MGERVRVRPGAFGQNVYMNDATGGAWYVLNNTPNGLPDTDGRVLFMQVTTAGELSGTINVQIFENGVGSESIYNTYDFSGTGDFSTGGGTTSNACGCTDPEADNYDDAAEYDDGSCEYAVSGCTDATACNYDVDATEDDGCVRMLRPATTAMVAASTTRTVTVYATSLKSRAARMLRHATTTRTRLMMTAAVPNWMSVACVAVRVSLTAPAIATATYWMNAVFVAVRVSLTANAIATATSSTSVVSAAVTALPRALVTATATVLKRVMTATAIA